MCVRARAGESALMLGLLWTVCQYPGLLDECALCMCSMVYLSDRIGCRWMVK